ncbi:hypothetical protein Terro_2674 [Terriglobus roseus DSM 18391]|uniref:YXWGXW repeat-containing protein n=1 Tax=Terriglobus roseus (strain DSM 18391 / NRRL B-41598 / KBS 63) TaxID=926566 RepID=I3ZI44_TERRK|nr:YXWGXW repeat-containing protein [Terriglobus roseus]AFL88571.1 hypothetical protein Terro_2310 [Terriglobus roseus DSM 18391]AFL88912.1 hypothetical protein Terro_2674 [Terriglobus roseus DSM 18391]
MNRFVQLTFAATLPLIAAVASIAPPSAAAQSFSIGIAIHTAPPALPVYVQPPCPTPGYLWTPGYWAYGPAGYYWVPGVWVAPPQVGYLWTPGYWGFASGAYGWHPGYWGPHVGFYGGVNYGFGYTGVGFGGGVWAGNTFRYNTAVMNVNTTVIHNTYVDRTVIVNNNINRVSFNGPGGIAARPTPQQMAFAHEQHVGATVNQQMHQTNFAQDRGSLASVNGGRPQTLAMNQVNGRRFDQQGRIAQGVASGQMTAGETRNVEGREANLNNTIRNDRAANGGSLTPQEQQNINQRQNNISNSIYNDKHNAAVQNQGNSLVGDREANQQQRIANGINSGQMTASEAARAESRQQNINQQVRADRMANGGRLNGPERQQVNREQNVASHQIQRENHNGREGVRRR